MFGPSTAARPANPVFTVSVIPKTAKSAEPANSARRADVSRATNPQLSTIDAHLRLSADGLVPSPTYEDTRIKGMVKHVAGLLSVKVSEPTWIAKEFAEQVAKIDSLRFNRVSVLCIKESRRNWRVKKHADGTVVSLTYKRNLGPFSKWNIARNMFVLLSGIFDSTLRLAVGPDFRIQLKEDCVIVESRVNRVCIAVPRQ